MEFLNGFSSILIGRSFFLKNKFIIAKELSFTLKKIMKKDPV